MLTVMMLAVGGTLSLVVGIALVFGDADLERVIRRISG